MDRQSIEVYKKALEEGSEKDYSIRLMVVGPHGVGKTALTKRLLEQDFDINQRDSTDGIDIHVRSFRISLKTSKWITEPISTGNKLGKSWYYFSVSITDNVSVVYMFLTPLTLVHDGNHSPINQLSCAVLILQYWHLYYDTEIENTFVPIKTFFFF